MTTILVLADTHATRLSELPQRISDLIRESEWVVHCGDYTNMRLVEDISRIARQFTGVCGNSDTVAVRFNLPRQTIIQVGKRKIAVIHPYWGGEPFNLVKELAAYFEGVDAILFGHTHESFNKQVNGTLMLNPGQGYPTFISPATAALLTVNESSLSAEIIEVK